MTDGNRPHYHMIVFNCDFGDKRLWTVRNGHKLYVSETLNSLWLDKNHSSLGFSSIGAVTFESAAYVARYCLKKLTGKENKEYCRVNFDAREKKYYAVPAEFAHMSNGIGKEWLKTYRGDVWPDDFVVVSGRGRSRVPRYYDKILEADDPLEFELIKTSRAERARQNGVDNTSRRLRDRETVKLAQISQLKRELE